MTKQELLEQHPELAAELRAEGAVGERERYDGHVKLGRQSGAVEMALRDYESGSAVTVTVMSAHMDHALRQNLILARGEDDLTVRDAASQVGVPSDSGGLTALASAVQRIAGGEATVLP